MKTTKTKIIIAAAIAAVSMAAFTGCNGTYSIDEKTGAVNITPAEASNEKQAAAAGDAQIKVESAADTASATESKAKDNNVSKAEDNSEPAQSSAPAQTITPAKNDVPVQTAAPVNNYVPAETAAAAKDTQVNSADIDTEALYDYALTAVHTFNTACYNASGFQVRWAKGTADDNFEPCGGTPGSFRYYDLGEYSYDYQQQIRDALYSGYLSEKICTEYDLHRAEYAIVEHDGHYYYDTEFMGPVFGDVFDCGEGSYDLIDDDTFAVYAMHKNRWNIADVGVRCMITLKKVPGTDSWQIDSIQDL